VSQSRFTRSLTFALLACAPILPCGCIEIILPEVDVPIDFTLLNGDAQFVVRGTAVVVESSGPCPAWIAENGVTYHLFQSPGLDNETFDRVTAPGTTSRLVLATRGDLELACQVGTIAQIMDVLEIVE